MPQRATWRLIEEGDGEAAWNMAVDEALMQSLTDLPYSDASSSWQENVPVLRMYGWKSASLSLGRFQSMERTLNLEAIQASKISVVRRITGGRGILHGDDLTISLATSILALGMPTFSTIADLYDPISTAFQHAFATVGIQACQGKNPTMRDGDTRGDCFATITRADLLERDSGIKLLGSALHRAGDVVLLQASIPLHTMKSRTWVQQSRRELFRGATADASAAAPCIDVTQMRLAIRQGFVTQFGCDFTPSQLSCDETALVHHLQQTRYRFLDWTRHAIDS